MLMHEINHLLIVTAPSIGGMEGRRGHKRGCGRFSKSYLTA